MACSPQAPWTYISVRRPSVAIGHCWDMGIYPIKRGNVYDGLN